MRHSTGDRGTRGLSFVEGLRNPRLAAALFPALLAPALGGAATPAAAAILLLVIGLFALALPVSPPGKVEVLLAAVFCRGGRFGVAAAGIALRPPLAGSARARGFDASADRFPAALDCLPRLADPAGGAGLVCMDAGSALARTRPAVAGASPG